MYLKNLKVLAKRCDLELVSKGKKLINTINAYSFCVAQHDEKFAESLSGGDALIPDGAGIVKANHFLGIKPRINERIAGWDLFEFEMDKLQRDASENGRIAKVLFLGSTEQVLSIIRSKVPTDYPNLDPITYSPPFKAEFSAEDNKAMVEFINACNPDLLWIGMTAPKQEKWAWEHWPELGITCHTGTIGAVFDFYAGTVKRAPEWMQRAGLEWLHRFCSNPKRLWRRYIVGNCKFILLILKEKFRYCRYEQ